MFENSYPFKWHAHLNDGRIIHQFDKGVQHKFTELEAAQELIDYVQITGLAQPIVINFPIGAKPIIFERVRSTQDGSNNDTERFHYFGFELNGNKTLLVIHGSTRIVSLEYDDSVTRS